VKRLGIILDTSFLIALNNSKDVNHKSAQALKTRIKSKEFGRCYISDFIFNEFVTFLRIKDVSGGRVREVGDALLADESIRLLKVGTDAFLQSWELFKKLGMLSFTDCATIILAKEFSVKNIASFDSDFDRIHYVKRICA
jgi:predicted nucleic acid-binding protein